MPDLWNHSIHPRFYDRPKDPKWEVDIENRVQYCLKRMELKNYEFDKNFDWIENDPFQQVQS